MHTSDALFENVNRLKKQGRPFALATVVRAESPTSAKPGAKAIVYPDGTIEGWIGGGCAQPAVINTAKQCLADGQARLIRVSPTQAGEGQEGKVEEGIIDFGMTCHSGGTLDIFIEPILSRPALLIIGASPAAQSLSRLATQLGFEVSVAFPGTNQEMFPDAAQIVDGLNIDLSSPPQFIVVSTQGKRDEPGLEAALSTGSDYIAFIASIRKAEKLRTYLKEQGHDPTRVDRILSPAGIEIGAVTPEEIALSVLAALVKSRREKRVDPETISGAGITRVGGPGEEQVHRAKSPERKSEQESERKPGETAIDPICGMTVEIATADFRYVHSGQTYYFCCAGCLHLFEKSPDIYLANAKEDT